LGTPVGISDHTVDWHVPLAAVALGARLVEKHLTLDRSDPKSLDNAGALEPDDFAAMVRQIRELEQALAPPDDSFTAAIYESRDWALQAIVAARPLPEGHVVAENDIRFKRPARGGILASNAEEVIGNRLSRDVGTDEQIRPDDLVDAPRDSGRHR
jgi:N,N'-diacetyllegionaminate synthase